MFCVQNGVGFFCCVFAFNNERERERDVNFVFFNEKLRYLRGECVRVRFEQLVRWEGLEALD